MAGRTRRIKQEILDSDSLSLPALKRGGGGDPSPIQVIQNIQNIDFVWVHPSVRVCPDVTVFKYLSGRGRAPEGAAAQAERQGRRKRSRSNVEGTHSFSCLTARY